MLDHITHGKWLAVPLVALAATRASGALVVDVGEIELLRTRRANRCR